jgi:mannitol/fructose-specific phosphotransferase system IIA component (Ntr-type)
MPIYKFLIPVFFCVMGMLIDIHALTSRTALVFGTAYAAAAIVAKIGGCGLPMLLCGFNPRGAMRVGVGMLPRCEVALTIAAIGLARGAVSHEVLGVAVFLMAVTTLAAPPALVALFRDGRPGTRRPTAVFDETRVMFPFPSQEIIDLLIPRLLLSFDNEGFFAHMLDRASQAYQLRKDDIVMGFRRRGNDIVFSCRQGHVALVNAVMSEAIADFERIVRGVQQPVDGKAIVRKMQDEAANGSLKVGLGHYLRPETLVPNLQATTKEGVIDELLRCLEKERLISNYDEAKRAVWAREQSMSTGMQYGIAIPHGRTDAVERLVCAVGLKRDGVDFDSIDGEPSRIIVLALSPERVSAPHMQFMSTVSQILDDSGREVLLACRKSREMFDVLARSATGSDRSISPGKALFRRFAGLLTGWLSRKP